MATWLKQQAYTKGLMNAVRSIRTCLRVNSLRPQCHFPKVVVATMQ